MNQVVRNSLILGYVGALVIGLSLHFPNTRTSVPFNAFELFFIVGIMLIFFSFLGILAGYCAPVYHMRPAHETG